MASTAPTLTRDSIEVHPVTGRIGAVLTGVDLRSVDDREVERIRAELTRHRVLFFREQTLSPGDQLEFAERFGPLTLAHPTRRRVATPMRVSSSCRARPTTGTPTSRSSITRRTRRCSRR